MDECNVVSLTTRHCLANTEQRGEIFGVLGTNAISRLENPTGRKVTICSSADKSTGQWRCA